MTNFKQLVPARADTVDKPGWCLRFTQSAFGAPADHRSAWHAWRATQHKHHERVMPGVAVPVWFRHEGDYDDGLGPYDDGEGNPRNWGHALVWIPGVGFVSSPMTKVGSPAGQTIFPTLESVERVVGPYAGYSEDINGLRVAEPTTFISSSESEDTMLYLMIIDGKGRYGKAGGRYFATYDGRVFMSLTPEDANAIANTNLAGRSFANITYQAWEGYQKAAQVVM